MKLSARDQLIKHVDNAIRSLFAQSTQSHHPYPAEHIEETQLSSASKKQSAAFMRINHCGEICAQALYQGQAITARDPQTQALMQTAADEELDHLAWCQQRLNELGDRTSYLNPLWYLGSLAIGCSAGFCGDAWSLGFIEETEDQVVRHLDSHLEKIDPADKKSQAIIKQMKIDEAKHATSAHAAGAASLPEPIKFMMQQSAKVMTTLSYYL